MSEREGEERGERGERGERREKGSGGAVGSCCQRYVCRQPGGLPRKMVYNLFNHFP